jgi:hypothetical protein
MERHSSPIVAVKVRDTLSATFRSVADEHSKEFAISNSPLVSTYIQQFKPAFMPEAWDVM